MSTETIYATAGSLAGLVVLTAAILGMSQCVSYDRWRERTCLSQGGAIVSNPSPGTSGGDGNKGCFKLTVEMQPLAMPAR